MNRARPNQRLIACALAAGSGLVLSLALSGCSAPSPPPAEVLPAQSAPVQERTADAPVALDGTAPTPLGFDDFSLRPTPPVRWTDRFEAEARLMSGVSAYTDVTYRWSVGGREVPAWRREFLRHREGGWRRGDLVEVYAVAEDGTGRVSRTETLAVRLGELPEEEAAPPPRPFTDWAALDAEDAARTAQREPPLEPERPEPEGPSDEELGRQGYYINPVLGGVSYDGSFPQPRRGITTGPQQTVDGWTPGEPRVDGWTPGEPRVDGWTPGEPRVGRPNQ